MQAAQHTFLGSRLVILHKMTVNTCLRKIIIIVRLHEIAPVISENSRLYYHQSFDSVAVLCHFYLSHLTIPPQSQPDIFHNQSSAMAVPASEVEPYQ